MYKTSVKIVVAAILAVMVLTIAIYILSAIAKAASYHIALQACKMGAFLKYVTDIKARVINFFLPITITSYACNIHLKVGDEWLDLLIKRMKIRADEDDRYSYVFETTADILKACKEILAKKNQLYEDTCKRILFYFTLAYLTKAAWDGFSNVCQKMSIENIFVVKTDIPMEVDEASLNIALQLLYSKEELEAVRSCEGKALYNNQIGKGERVCNIITDLYVICNDYLKKKNCVEYTRTLAKWKKLGDSDEIIFDNEGLIKLKEGEAISIGWYNCYNAPPLICTQDHKLVIKKYKEEEE